MTKVWCAPILFLPFPLGFSFLKKSERSPLSHINHFDHVTSKHKINVWRKKTLFCSFFWGLGNKKKKQHFFLIFLFLRCFFFSIKIRGILFLFFFLIQKQKEVLFCFWMRGGSTFCFPFLEKKKRKKKRKSSCFFFFILFFFSYFLGCSLKNPYLQKS